MPRAKSISDSEVLRTVLGLLHARGPEAVTFAAAASECGLSAATLVQRFGTRAQLIRKALLFAWDRLEEQTQQLSASVPKTPEGAITFLASLSRTYGDIETYANGLLVLREDIRDPALRKRGAAWKAALSDALADCFDEYADPVEMGFHFATLWQGALLWWSFDPSEEVDKYVESRLKSFLASVYETRVMSKLP